MGPRLIHVNLSKVSCIRILSKNITYNTLKGLKTQLISSPKNPPAENEYLKKNIATLSVTSQKEQFMCGQIETPLKIVSQ